MGPRTLLSLCMTGLGALVVAAALALVAAGCGASAAPEAIPQTMRTAAATPKARSCAAPGRAADVAGEPPLRLEPAPCAEIDPG